MNTTKRIFLFAFSVLLLSSTTTLNAQVTIGAETAPKSYSLLELNTSEVDGGLRLPQLTTTKRNALTLDADAKGLMIFNTSTNCIEVWNGTTWNSTCGTESTALPFNYLTGDGETNLPVWQSVDLGSANVVLKIVVEDPSDANPDFEYVWYQQTVDEQYGTGVFNLVKSGSDNSLTVTPGATRSNIRYYCKITNKNSNVSLDSPFSRIIVGGCGAYLGAGNTNWKKFQCHDLGADASADPFTPSNKIHGSKYVWGLANAALSRYEDQATPGSIGYWSFFEAAVTSDWNMSTNNPCPTGWRLPTRAEWEQVIANNPETRIGSWTSGENNYLSAIKIGNALFLLNSGFREVRGALVGRGERGYYWSSDKHPLDTYACMLYFTTSISTRIAVERGNLGFNARCIEQ